MKTLQNGAHGKGVKCLGYRELHSVGSLILIFMSSCYSRAFVDKIKYNKDVQPYFGPQVWANFCLHGLINFKNNVYWGT